MPDPNPIRAALFTTAATSPIALPPQLAWTNPPGTLEYHGAAECARLLSSGSVQAALVSSSDFLRLSERLLLVPELATVVLQGSGELLLLSDRRPDLLEGETVIASREPPLLAPLARALFRDYYRARVRVEAVEDDGLEPAAAGRLVGGDAALGTPTGEAPFTEDLTLAWWLWTGLPLVTAVFAVRADAARERSDELQRLRDELVRGARLALDQLPTLAAAAAGRAGLGEAAVAALYPRLAYRLDQEAQRGLRTLASKLAALRLAPREVRLATF